VSLISALNTASTALQTMQSAIQVVSENVANAQNPNYAQRTAVLAELPNGVGVGVEKVQRATDAALQTQSLDQSSLSSRDSTLSTLYGLLNDATGGNTTTPPLTTTATAFQQAWQTYETTPEDSAAQTALLGAASDLTQAVTGTAAGVEQLATTAQGNVGSDIATLNSDLSDIETLNKNIVSEQAANIPVADLQDQRDAKVAEIASLVSIRTVARPDGSLSVFTPGGLALLDRTASNFSWDGTNITLTGSPGSLNSSFQNGGIGATLGFLRTDNAAVQSTDPNLGALQKLRNQLDSFAQSFYDTAAATPPAFEAAYDGASTEPGELASSFFTTSDGAATANRFDLAVNPQLLNGSGQVKQAAAPAVVAALTQGSQSLNTGGLAISGQTYAQVANAIVANTSSSGAFVASAAKSSSAISSALTTRLSGETGVNIDQEMSNLVVLQNSYAAAARVLTTVNSMLTDLMTVVH
jgi:flagellar hook-associated protein 1 FlgK